MGFEGKSVIRLKFDDPALSGLEVVVRKPQIFQTLAMGDRVDELIEEYGTEEKAGVHASAELLCKTLIGWNLENDGEKVPHTADALLEQDQDVSMAIIRAWEAHVMTVSGPKEQSSNDGESSVAASIPMEPLSESLAS